MQIRKYPERSAFVDLVMKDATEEERIEATRNWFGFLATMMKIAREEELRKQAGDASLVRPHEGD